MCRAQKDGNRGDFGLGSASKVSLATARERAREIRTWVELGLDPIFERRKAQDIPTFRQAAAKVIAAHSKTGGTRSTRNSGSRRSRPMCSRTSAMCGPMRLQGP